MYLRRLAVPVAALAAGAAFLPANASAASAAASHPSQHASTAHGATLAAGAETSAFKTFSSPASKSVRLQKAATAPVTSRITATGTTIYASATGNCATDTGDGSQAKPYCNAQDAVNAAVSGDTVDLLTSFTSFPAPVTVTTSGISIVGTGTQAWLYPVGGDAGKPALVLNGVHDVTVSNLMLSASGAPTAEIIGSSRVSFDSDYVNQQTLTHADAITIDGTSSDITVSRTYVDDGPWSAAGQSAIAIAAGAAQITLTGDAIAASGIKATGVKGLDVTGDTIQRACAPAVDVEGGSTGVFLENNLLEDVTADSSTYLGGDPSQCAAKSQTWAPDVVVSADSSANTTSDYNDFYVYGTDGTDLYSWAGAAYSALPAFQSGTGQGAHDLLDSKQPFALSLRYGWAATMDARLVKGSAAIGSANTSAPGELTSDFFGLSPYTSRGAIQYNPVDPTLALALTAANTSALAISFQAVITSSNVPLQYTMDWGDGITQGISFGGGGGYTYSVGHSYGKPGIYTITATVTDNQGDTETNTLRVATAGSDYTAYGPARILDTRHGVGIGGTAAKLGSGATLQLRVGGAGPQGGTIPTGISAVVLNLTVTNPAAGGYLTAYPNQGYLGVPQRRPTASNVNFTPGQTVPNLAIVPVGPDGIIDIYNGSGGPTDVIGDVSGYFSQSAASGYSSLSPYRLVDTRKGLGAPKAPLPSGGSIAVQITGADGGLLPSSSVAAVALNVTVVNPQAGGYLTAYPDGVTRPTASNLNFGGGQVIANAVIVPVGTDGKIRVFNGSIGSSNVLVDLVGYYDAASKGAYVPMTPVRFLDTRTWQYGPLTPGGYAFIYNKLSINDSNVSAFVLNTTVTNTKGSGYETVSPDPNTWLAYANGWAVFPTPPNVSTLNWNAGQVVPNLVQASTGQNGIIDFWDRSGGNMDLVVDQFGYYQAD